MKFMNINVFIQHGSFSSSTPQSPFYISKLHEGRLGAKLFKEEKRIGKIQRVTSCALFLAVEGMVMGGEVSRMNCGVDKRRGYEFQIV